MDSDKTRKLISAVKKRMRSGSQEESENEILKDLFDGDLGDFLTLLDTLDESTKEIDPKELSSEPEVFIEAVAMVNTEENSTEHLNLQLLKELTAREDILNIFTPLFIRTS